MRRRLRRLLAGLLIVAAGEPGAAASAERPDLAVLPQPDVTRLEAAVRRQIEEATRALGDLAADPDTPLSALAGAYGLLGQVFLLYELDEAAAAAFANARALDPADHRWAFYLGAVHQKHQRFEAAVEAFEAALAERPEDVPTLLHLARIELVRGRLERSADLHRRVLVLDPESAAARYGLGQIAYRAGRLEEAAERLEAALAAQPEASAAHYALGLVYRDLGDLEGARRHVARQGDRPVTYADPLLDQLPRLARGAAFHLYFGARAAQAGDLERALRHYRRALAEEPDNAAARQSLAVVLGRSGDSAGAVEELRRVVEREPESATAALLLGTALGTLGQREEAVEHLRRAVRLDPRHRLAHRTLAGLLEELGSLQEAERHAAQVLELDPQDTEARRQRAELLRRLGRLEEAAAQLGEVARQQPHDGDVLLRRAALLVALERPGEAGEVLRRALALELPAALQAEARLALARLLLEGGTPEEALPHLREAARLDPGDREAQALLAGTLGRTGRHAEAAETFTRLVALAPDDASAHFGRATALLLSERYVEARSALEGALVRWPHSAPLRTALARLLAGCPDAALRDGERALVLARQVAGEALTLEHAGTVAMALAELGRFPEAAALQERIVTEAEAAGSEALLAVLRRRLEGYRRGEPVRAPWREGEG